MSVSERQRHALHEWAKNAASEEVAETLMDLLPPVGWADVATKRDLAQMESRLELRFESMHHRFEGELHRLEGELHRQLRQHTYWIMTSVWAAVGVAVGLSQAL